MSEKPRSLHEIVGMPEGDPDVIKKKTEKMKAMARVDWHNHKQRRQKGKPQRDGGKGIDFPLHTAESDPDYPAELDANIEREELAKDEDTDEVEMQNLVKPDSQD